MKTFIVISFSLALPTLALAQADDNSRAGATVDTGSALVQLQGDPLSTGAGTRPPPGQKIDFNSDTVRSYRARLAASRNDFKAWLRANAPKAKVTGEFEVSLNAVSVELNGTSLETIRQSTLVKSADYETLYHKNTDDPDLGLIQAVEAWQVAGGPANAGVEVRVAIIDSGIDIRHPCFDDAGYPPKTRLGDKRFTNNKVIAAKVFNNKAARQGLTAEAIDSHGTHVAGTAGCNFQTPAIVNGVTIPYGVSGVAPRVLLGNYNVFPGTVEDARPEDILNALESAYTDGFDVANLSLGGTPHSGRLGFQDLVAEAVNNLDQANMVVAVAAGNGGPGHFTVESPGAAARALTAGASSVPHYIATPVTVGGSSYGAASGQFSLVTNNLTAPLAVVLDGANLSRACSPLAAGSLNGRIALVLRGTCTFSTKIRIAQDAGALAVLVVNNVAGDPVAMSQDGTPNQPTIPAYMLGRADGTALLGADGATTTIHSAQAYYLSANADIMAGFSSQGPTDVDFRVKPDVVAPGVNVLSSIPVAYCGGDPCWAFFQGTSMAAPHLAGSAAVVRGQHPDWSAAQIRSAIVNTADRGVLKNFLTGAREVDDNITGAGRENLLSAVQAQVALDPVSVSFGGVPAGSGQTRTANLQVSKLGAGAATYSLAVDAGGDGVAYALSPSTISLSAGASRNITVTMSAAKGAAPGGYQSILTVSSGGQEVAHAVVFTLVK